ncbi:hypothetical protein C8R44DRAFT_748038 [Mycena epipterygia]|nr:hypothetical protein C8R44DRAFT_748038 [Mycena epipterygia]
MLLGCKHATIPPHQLAPSPTDVFADLSKASVAVQSTAKTLARELDASLRRNETLVREMDSPRNILQQKHNSSTLEQKARIAAEDALRAGRASLEARERKVWEDEEEIRKDRAALAADLDRTVRTMQSTAERHALRSVPISKPHTSTRSSDLDCPTAGPSSLSARTLSQSTSTLPENPRPHKRTRVKSNPAGHGAQHSSDASSSTFPRDGFDLYRGSGGWKVKSQYKGPGIPPGQERLDPRTLALDQDLLSRNSTMQQRNIHWEAAGSDSLFAECQIAYDQVMEEMESVDEKTKFLNS